MTDTLRQQAAFEVDLCIERYTQRCQSKIDHFCESHFSLEDTWNIQKKTFWMDLLLAPLNSAWAIPYLSIKKGADILSKFGFVSLNDLALRIPSGIRTGYQRKMEALICAEILEWDLRESPVALPQGLLEDLSKVPSLSPYLIHDPECRGSLRRLINDFFSTRAMVCDLSGTVLTLLLGWCTFGNSSIGLHDIANSFAKKRAHDDAVNHFFLGKSIGSTFYNICPPRVDENQVLFLTILLGIGLTIGAMTFTISSDPLRKLLGLHKTRLKVFLNDFEKELLLFSHKKVKKVFLENAALKNQN
jgi:hypothetical protein